MIEVTPTANTYLRKLVEQQDEPGLGLRLRVVQPGTPLAACDLHFCSPGNAAPTDHVLELDGYNLWVEDASVPWLDEASVDFEQEPTGGQLSIRAPGIKGHEPEADAPLEQRVQYLLDHEINPGLAAHGGHAVLEEITAEHDIVLRFGGGCHGCGMVDVTLKQGIERVVKDKLPEVRDVLDATDHESGKNPFYQREGEGQSAL